jgi:ornithine decarboxylase
MVGDEVQASYYKFDLDFLDQAYSEWTKVFPTIRPFYAVKCNPHPLIVERMARLGAGFDCASPAEIDIALQFVDAGDVLYAHPCKRPCDIRYARSKNIKRTTFDSVCELQKIAIEAPDMEVILRIKADDPHATCPLGNKYGADTEKWEELLSEVKRLGLNLVGISFHVGSGAQTESAYIEGAKKANVAANMAIQYGLNPTVIDIGGGFTYDKIPTGLSSTVSDYLVGFEVIAEPGRYFAERVATLYTPVIGYKDGAVTIDESLYGAFNCKMFDHAVPVFCEKAGPTSAKSIFGCTCDGIDVICESVQLPELKVGDVLEWPRMGAYTMAATTSFNGIPFNNRQVKT